MKQFDFESCIKEGLLRNIPPSKEKAEESIKAGFRWLEEAEKDLRIEAFNSSVLSSYLAMFHSARALLYFDGYREKSHYCIARYLEEKYVKKKLLESKWIELLDHYRELRHNDQYSISFFATKDEAESALRTAKEFVERLRNILRTKK
ncbi:MAG TPA: HEPN domain-containing protein [Candidatus Methanoperedens sp.]